MNIEPDDVAIARDCLGAHCALLTRGDRRDCSTRLLGQAPFGLSAMFRAFDASETNPSH